MRRSIFRIALVGSAVLGCATSGARSPLGNDPTLVPAVPWQEFERYDFTVELARPGHVAVLRWINTSGKNSLTLLYPDSTTTDEAARRIDVDLPRPRRGQAHASAAPLQRTVKRCIEYTRAEGADSAHAYRWGCGWTLETVDVAPRFPRRENGLDQVYYVVVAFDTPRSVEALRAAARQVNAELKSTEVARQFGTVLFGSEGSARWGATLWFVPRLGR